MLLGEVFSFICAFIEFAIPDLFVYKESLKNVFKTSFLTTNNFINCGCMLLIEKGYPVIKRLVFKLSGKQIDLFFFLHFINIYIHLYPNNRKTTQKRLKIRFLFSTRSNCNGCTFTKDIL